MTNNAYIQCAIYNTPFLESGKNGWNLTCRHHGTYWIFNIAYMLISILGKFLIAAMSVLIYILVYKQMYPDSKTVLGFALVLGSVAFMVAS